MGQRESVPSVNVDYNLQDDFPLKPYYKHKDKYVSVVIEKGRIEKINIPEPDLTVGWLLSEVTRRYDSYFEEKYDKNGKERKAKKVIVGLKCALFYPTLDKYLSELDNPLAPIKHKTTFTVHYAKMSNEEGSIIHPHQIGPQDFKFIKVIGKGSY